MFSPVWSREETKQMVSVLFGPKKILNDLSKHRASLYEFILHSRTTRTYIFRGKQRLEPQKSIKCVVKKMIFVPNNDFAS